jgi:putative hydrolase
MLKIDLHIHTVASGHAQNTILEFINQAKDLKMEVIGISDHGPGKTDVFLCESYFRTLPRIPDVVSGVRVLKGVEANIINGDGDIDIDEKAIKNLDYVMANFHENCGYEDCGKEGNTQAMIKMIESGKVDIITHPTSTKPYETDLKKICEAACQNDVLLELNLARLHSRKIKPETISNLKTMIEIAKRHGKKIIAGSDAHNIWELGDDSLLLPIKNEIGLTDDLIINNYPEELFRFLGVARNISDEN